MNHIARRAQHWLLATLMRHGQAWGLFVISSLFIFSGAYIGRSLYLFDGGGAPDFGFFNWYGNWDGQWYAMIAREGYGFSLRMQIIPDFVFFPLVPLLGYLTTALTSLPEDTSIWLVSLLATFTMVTYWQRIIASHPVPKPSDAGILSLTLLMYWPTSYFLRVGYTEAVYLLAISMWLWSMYRQAKLRWVIFFCGFITASRPTGLHCSLISAIFAWRHTAHMPLPLRLLYTAGTGFLSAWGIMCYMVYLHHWHGDAFLFLTSQLHWNHGAPPNIFALRLEEMLLLKPLWWNEINNFQGYFTPYFLQNKVMYLLAILLTLVGICKSWLTVEEILFCTLSLTLFYFYKGPHDLEAVGRYCLSLVPLFLVAARIMSGWPPSVRYSVVAILGSIMFLNVGLFAQLHSLV